MSPTPTPTPKPTASEAKPAASEANKTAAKTSKNTPQSTAPEAQPNPASTPNRFASAAKKAGSALGNKIKDSAKDLLNIGSEDARKKEEEEKKKQGKDKVAGGEMMELMNELNSFVTRVNGKINSIVVGGTIAGAQAPFKVLNALVDKAKDYHDNKMAKEKPEDAKQTSEKIQKGITVALGQVEKLSTTTQMSQVADSKTPGVSNALDNPSADLKENDVKVSKQNAEPSPTEGVKHGFTPGG